MSPPPAQLTNGVPGGFRDPDLPGFNRPLCHLSYGHLHLVSPRSHAWFGLSVQSDSNRLPNSPLGLAPYQFIGTRTPHHPWTHSQFARQATTLLPTPSGVSSSIENLGECVVFPTASTTCFK